MTRERNGAASAESDDAWYVSTNDGPRGPFSLDRLRRFVAEGKLPPRAKVRPCEAGDWMRAGEVPALFPPSTPAEELGGMVPAAPTPPQVPVPAPPTAVAVGPPPTPPAAPAADSKDCPFCGEEVRATAKKCKHCGEILDVALRAAEEARRAAAAPAAPAGNVVNVTNVVGGVAPRWSRGTAALLSLFIPGLGQMYKGQIVNGLAWFLFVVVGYFLLIVPGLVLHLLCVLGAASGDPRR